MTSAVIASRVDVATRDEWDAHVRATPNASFCHLWDWGTLIQDVFGHEPVFRVVRSSDTSEVLGALPLYDLKSAVFGRHLVSVPFMNYGGPCGSAEARASLANWAMEEADRRQAKSLLLRTRIPLSGTLPVTQSKLTMVLPLRASSDDMWKNEFDTKFRSKIKRPQREGMSTVFGVHQFDAFYEVFARNMRDLGTPVLPSVFFERVMASFADLVLLGVTYHQSRPVAAGFGFIWRDEFEMTWSSSLKEFRASKPNMLLYWDYMRELIARGVRRFNFGRSTPGSGPHEFKRSWGAAEEALPWIQWPPESSGAGDSRVVRIASAVWRRLPLPVTNVMGPVLARQLPWW